MDSTTTILSDYRDNLEIYQGLKDDIEDIINRILKQNQIKISNLAIRIKSEKSLTKKIQFKNKYHHASDITDLVACRIITLFEDDVEKLKHLISQNFEVVEIVDKRKKENRCGIWIWDIMEYDRCRLTCRFFYNEVSYIFSKSSKSWN